MSNPSKGLRPTAFCCALLAAFYLLCARLHLGALERTSGLSMLTYVGLLAHLLSAAVMGGLAYWGVRRSLADGENPRRRVYISGELPLFLVVITALPLAGFMLPLSHVVLGEIVHGDDPLTAMLRWLFFLSLSLLGVFCLVKRRTVVIDLDERTVETTWGKPVELRRQRFSLRDFHMTDLYEEIAQTKYGQYRYWRLRLVGASVSVTLFATRDRRKAEQEAELLTRVLDLPPPRNEPAPSLFQSA